MAKPSFSGQRRTGDFTRRDSAQVQLSPEDIKKSGVRVTALRVLLKEAEGNIPALALAVGLGTQRVRDALDGVLGIGSELAAHIEHTAHLPGAWLDHPDEALPDRTKERIQKAMRGEQLDDDDEDESASAPTTTTPAAAAPVLKSQAFVDVQEPLGLRVVKAPPRISVRRRRVTQAEALAPEAPPALVETPAPSAPAPAVTLDLVQAQQAPRRGRKAGVKSVSDDIEANRREWLRFATEPKNAKSQLCRLLQAPDSFVAHLLSGRRTFTDKISGKIEEVMRLPEGTIDSWVPGSTVNTVPMPSSPMPVAPQVAVIEAVEVTPPAAVQAAPVVTAPVAEVAKAPAPAPAAQVSAPQAPVPAPAATPSARVLDEYIEGALKGVLERAIATGKMDNQVALRLLQELAAL